MLDVLRSWGPLAAWVTALLSLLIAIAGWHRSDRSWLRDQRHSLYVDTLKLFEKHYLFYDDAPDPSPDDLPAELNALMPRMMLYAPQVLFEAFDDLRGVAHLEQNVRQQYEGLRDEDVSDLQYAELDLVGKEFWYSHRRVLEAIRHDGERAKPSARLMGGARRKGGPTPTNEIDGALQEAHQEFRVERSKASHDQRQTAFVGAFFDGGAGSKGVRARRRRH